MNVTSLFVELLACGMGVAAWLAILACALMRKHPFDVLQNIPTTPVWCVAALAIGVYGVGVGFDRLIDKIFDCVFFKIEDKHAVRRSVFRLLPERRTGRGMSTTARAQESRLAEWLDYYRHRMRMTRALSFNALLISLCILFAHFRATCDDNHRAPVACSVVIALVIFVVALVSWGMLVNDYEESRPHINKLLNARDRVSSPAATAPTDSER